MSDISKIMGLDFVDVVTVLINGTFDSNLDGWTLDAGDNGGTIDWHGSGQLQFNQGGTFDYMVAYQAVQCMVGRTYRLTLVVEEDPNNWSYIAFDDDSAKRIYTEMDYCSPDQPEGGLVTVSGVASASTMYVFLCNANGASVSKRVDTATIELI